tara:strand:+ start:2296 stop:4224 length:1929 start_codon:yes stop_codon:yes gene_type:complete
MGFMAGFGPAFAAGLERNADRKSRKQEILLSSRLKDIQDRTTAYTKAKAEDAANVKLAKSLVEMVPGAPKEVWKDMYSKLSSGVPQSSVLDFYKNVDFKKVEETPATVETKAPAVETQMEEAIPTASTQPTVDVSASGVSEAPVTTPDNKPLDFMERLKQRSDERLSAEVDQQAKDILGEDVYEMAGQTYTPTDFGSSGYTATAKPKDKKTPKYLDTIPTKNNIDGLIAMAQREKDADAVQYLTTLKTTFDNTSPTSFEQIYVSTLLNTEGWKDKTPEQQQQMVSKAKQALSGASKGTDTLTDAKLAALHAKYTKMQGSADPEEAAQGDYWMEFEYPVLRSSLEAVKSIGSKDTPKILKLTVQTEDGNTKVVDGLYTDKGYVTATTGEPVGGTVINASTSDTFDKMQKSTSATQAIRLENINLRDASFKVASAGYELANVAAEFPQVTTATGQAAAIFSSAKTELLTALEFIAGVGATQDEEKGNFITKSRLLQDVNEFFKGDDSSKTDQVSEEVKLFTAAIIRYVYQAGKALGQQGNGFSNQDFNVILRAVKASNNAETFAKNIQQFSKERFQDSTIKANSTSANGSIKLALSLNAPIDTDIMGPEEYANEFGGDYLVHYNWAHGQLSDELLEQLNAEDGE